MQKNIRRQRARKDKVRASLSYSKARGVLLSLDFNSSIRSITGWAVGDYFSYELVDLLDRYRFVIRPATINGYRLSSTANRRARVVFPIKIPSFTSGAISKLETKVFGDELFIDVAKTTLSFKEKSLPHPTLFQWAQNEGSTTNDQL